MKKFFAPNLDQRGRIFRAVWAVLMFVAAILTFQWSAWAAIALFAFGVFALIEALRGWCIMRACGIKTKY